MVLTKRYTDYYFIDSCPRILDYIYHTIGLLVKAVEWYLYVIAVNNCPI